MRAWLIAVALMLGALPAAQAESFYLEGAQYEAIVPPAPADAPAGKVEVVEMFWYGCPHCYRFEPYLSRWLENKPENVSFKRVPAVLNPNWVVHARAYYAAQMLGVEEKIHADMFRAIHEQGRRLDTEEALAAFFAAHGVPEDKFREAFNSFEVHMKLREAARLGRAYQLGGVPAMVVNGKYRVTGSLAGSYPEMLNVVQHLVQQEAGLAEAR